MITIGLFFDHPAHGVYDVNGRGWFWVLVGAGCSGLIGEEGRDIFFFTTFLFLAFVLV